MSDRETKIIETSSGYKIEVHTFITGRELRQIQEIFLNEMQLKNTGGKPEIGAKLKGEQLGMAEDLAIEAIVKSINDNTEDVLNCVLDLPAIDFGEVKKYIDEISDVKKKNISENQN